MAKQSVVGTFALDGECETVSTEVTGTVSEALNGFRQQCMEHLSIYLSVKSGAVVVEPIEEVFNETVTEDGVATYVS